ncbi:angiotensin-converting enzyme-like [Schistocerca nitens]|uniref:angiotensin-converting enzyme-like n=1 Tax=Schistocerca nitens TaxID=7011 RepID=UPI0021183BD4|nr:angiotensin-converting enzyme-like [Schistocerca nitens]XP_049797670.1 angiotensin-converting enzyme-like [Schistocerca nitens]
MTCSTRIRPRVAALLQLLLVAAPGYGPAAEAQLYPGQYQYQDEYQGPGYYPPGYQEREPPYEVVPPPAPPAAPNGTAGVEVVYAGVENRMPALGRQELPLLLDAIDVESSQQCTRHVTAQWRYETDVNPATQAAALQSQEEYARFQRALWQIVRQVRPEQVQGNPRLARTVRLLSVMGPSALPPELLDRYNRIIREMLAVYETATICAYKDAFLCSLRLDPDLTLIMARSRDWDELQYVWKEYHDKTGMKVRDLFEQLVDVSNEAARVNNFTDTAEYWMFPYESPTFRTDVDYVWSQIQPLYAQLHAYVRRKLRDLYGPDKINRRAPLPSHILGNMWAQSWSNILDVTIPYPGKNFLNVGPELLAQGYTPLTMFRLADDFYRSLNLSAVPPEFWERSLLEQPLDRPVICQPSAWDFCNRRDYRIKMCTQVTMTDLVTAHHEMGHIQYFLQYRNQPKVFRDAANPGLHEAVGDTIALSVSTPQHLQTLGLLRNSVDDLPHNINYLFAQALDKLAFLPYALVLDLWRWDIFEGRTPKTRYNCDYWRLRENYSGVKPPVLRSEIDFDPGSKYHVVANIPYIK